MAPVDSKDYVLSGIYYFVLVRNTCQHSQQTRRWPNAGPMLARNLRRWPNIKPALVQRLLFAGLRSTQWAQNIIVMCPSVECFGMFWKSKTLQVRDYLYKWTEFFRIKIC